MSTSMIIQIASGVLAVVLIFVLIQRRRSRSK